MKNKLLNIIGIIAVLGAIFFATTGDKNMPGKFNLNALESAEQNVAAAIDDARNAVENLVKIKNKTYMNFVRPYMDIDAKLDSVVHPIIHLDMVNNSDETQKIVNAILPMISDFSSDMARHRGVYQGMLDIKNSEYDSLNAAQKKLIDDSIKAFRVSGIDLPADKQKKLKEISALVSQLSNDFSNNIIAANKLNKIKIVDEKLLGEMPQSDKDAARVDDGWEFSLLAPSYAPFMEYVTDRDLREKMYKNYVTRAMENEKIIPQILALRDEYAKILGFENHAQLAFVFRDAKSPAMAAEYLNKIANTAKPAALREFSELNDFAGFDIKPWDTGFYSRLLKQKKYSLTDAETKPYFEMNATINGVMDVLANMFDIKFQERKVPIWNDNAKYFDVMENGRIIAGLYIDLQSRESKQSGAWMDDLKAHYVDSAGNEHLSEIVVVGNFPAATADTPSLLKTSDVSTFFHEMGHAVHGLLTRVAERDMAGTNVDRDVVEFPSQFLEAFWNNKTVLKKIGRHYQTGKVIPDDLIERIIAADRFQRAMFIVRQLEFGIFDLQLHQLGAVTADTVQKTLDDVRKSVAVIKYPDYNKFQNTFSHIFAGGYSAGYYSYMWAENMAADAYLAFKGNPFNTELMSRYRNTILANGGEKDMSDLYMDFLGRAPNPNSLLKFYGF